MMAGALCVSKEVVLEPLLCVGLVSIGLLVSSGGRGTYQDTDNTRALWILLLEKRGLSSRLISTGEVGLMAHILTHLSICEELLKALNIY
jgi:hypothetical protein